MSKWKTVKLGEVGVIITGNTPKTSDKENYLTNDISFYRPSDIVERNVSYLNSSEAYVSEVARSKVRMLPKGSILVTCIGIIGKIGILEHEATFNQQINAIIPNQDICLNRYIAYSIFFNRDRLRDIANAPVVPIVNKTQFSNMIIPLPPLEEQKRIADILDKASNLIELRKQQLEKMDLLIKSKFIDMFGDPVTNPKGWEVKKLVEVTNKIGSGSTPRGGKESYIEEGISLIRSMNVYDGRFKYHQLAYIDKVQAKQMDIVTVIENDVLINITGASVARSCVVPKDVLPARVNQHVSIVRCICEKLNPIYLNQLFISDSYKSVLLAVGGAGGATREAITKQQLEKLDILIPPIKLQNQFATFVEQVEKQKTVMQQSLEKMETNYKALMQKYFG
jgi:type I restriction enzyme S subunit